MQLQRYRDCSRRLKENTAEQNQKNYSAEVTYRETTAESTCAGHENAELKSPAGNELSGLLITRSAGERVRIASATGPHMGMENATQHVRVLRADEWGPTSDRSFEFDRFSTGEPAPSSLLQTARDAILHVLQRAALSQNLHAHVS